LLLVYTSEVDPLGLGVERVVVVAAREDPVKEMDQEPSVPDGFAYVEPVGFWLAMYSVQVPFITLLLVPKKLKS
jgi:hypothetical protein